MSRLARLAAFLVLNAVCLAAVGLAGVRYAAQMPAFDAFALLIDRHPAGIKHLPAGWRLLRWSDHRLTPEKRRGLALSLAWPALSPPGLTIIDTSVSDVTTATTVDALRRLAASAAPGTTLRLAPGDYEIDRAVALTASGTAAAPLRLVGGPDVRLFVSSPTGLRVNGAHWIVEGLEIRGVCAPDSACISAIDVTEKGTAAKIRSNRLIDFDTPLSISGFPAGVGIVGNLIAADHPRDTKANVTFLAAEAGEGLLVSGNLLRDFATAGKWSDFVSYGIRLSGGARARIEDNILLCATTGGYGRRIGIALDNHGGAAIRDNIVANCTDAAIDLTDANDSRIEGNLLYLGRGIDLKGARTTARIVNNVFDGRILARGGAAWRSDGNFWSPWAAIRLKPATPALIPGIAAGELAPGPGESLPLKPEIMRMGAGKPL